MKNRWYVIKEFYFMKPKHHLDLIKNLLEEDSKVLFAKNELSFDEFDDETKQETIEEDFIYYMDNSMPKEEIKIIDFKVKDFLYSKYGKSINKSVEETKISLLKDLKSGKLEVDSNTLKEIKELAILTRYLHGEETSLYTKGILRFKEIKHLSFNNYITQGEFARDCIKEGLDWYQFLDEKLIYEFIDYNSTYYATITKDINNFMNYDYYLHMIETIGELNSALAINDNKGDFKSNVLPKMRRLFGDKFKIVEYDLKYGYDIHLCPEV